MEIWKVNPVIETNFETAELIKYMNNCFFAAKVSFLNEMKILGEKVGADWNTSVEGFVRDGRIGHSHLSVPGPDGKLGFGGELFPKRYSGYHKFCGKARRKAQYFNWSMGNKSRR